MMIKRVCWYNEDVYFKYKLWTIENSKLHLDFFLKKHFPALLLPFVFFFAVQHWLICSGMWKSRLTMMLPLTLPCSFVFGVRSIVMTCRLNYQYINSVQSIFTASSMFYLYDKSVQRIFMTCSLYYLYNNSVRTMFMSCKMCFIFITTL